MRTDDNLIGLRKDLISGKMILAAGNGGHGVRVDGGQNTRIGGTTAAEANSIVASAGNGIHLTNALSTTIQSNQVGTLVSATTASAIPNQQKA